MKMKVHGNATVCGIYNIVRERARCATGGENITVRNIQSNFNGSNTWDHGKLFESWVVRANVVNHGARSESKYR